MTTLYAHVGVPKSGTTSLQDNLRRDERINYIDTFYFHKADFWQDQDFTLSDEKVNVLSNETFSVRGRGGGKVPLYCILQRLLSVCGDTRIVLTIRKQPTALASMFRHSILMGGNFTCFNDWLTGDEGMEYYAATQYGILVQSMLPFVSQQNIKVLCFEEMVSNPRDFYSELYDFLNLPFEPDRIICSRHSNKTSPREQVYARNILNACVGTGNRLARRVNLLSTRVLKSALKKRIPENFFSLKSVDCYDGVLAEVRSSNQLLLEYYPALEPLLRKHGYAL